MRLILTYLLNQMGHHWITLVALRAVVLLPKFTQCKALASVHSKVQLAHTVKSSYQLSIFATLI